MADPTNYHIVVIGGGGTGAALAYDLAQRGYRATLLERGELTSGTTGRHHGQLHSGARYAAGDRSIARECMEETRVLMRIAPEAIEYNSGLFVALTAEDEAFAETFVESCAEAGIPTERLSAEACLRLEPGLNPAIRCGVRVPDGTLDAWRLPLHFFAAARGHGALIRNFAPVVGIELDRTGVRAVRMRDLRSKREEEIGCDLVINAAGAWAGQVAGLAGVSLPLTPAPGSMLAVRKRLTNLVVSRLHPAGDGDILVPQRGLSIIGSTQWQTDDPDDVVPSDEEVEFLRESAVAMVPGFAEAPYQAAWAAVRPLAGASVDVEAGRALSRDFVTIDHGKNDGVGGLVSLIGGKATTLRAMAEQAVDVVGGLLDVSRECRTAEYVLPSHRAYYRNHATEPERSA